MVNLYRMRMLIRQATKLQWRKEREIAKATKITTVLTGMPRGGSGKNQVEDGAIKVAELEEAYIEVLEELRSMKRELSPLINTIENADLRAAMRLRYIDEHRPEEIADAIPLAERTVYRYLKQGEDEICRKFPDKVVRSSISQICQ
jgi:DNA-directed RNA polymerase specialized sigma24 family protein